MFRQVHNFAGFIPLQLDNIQYSIIMQGAESILLGVCPIQSYISWIDRGFVPAGTERCWGVVPVQYYMTQWTGGLSQPVLRGTGGLYHPVLY